MSKLSLSILLMSLLVLSNARAYDEFTPYAPDSHTAAVKAVKALGPELGAVKIISTEPIRILGLDSSTQGNSLNIISNVTNLDAAIQDLKAQVAQDSIRVDLSGDVLFDFDKSDIRPEAEVELKKLLLIVQKKAVRVSITGHTDSKGDDEYNQILSEKRAHSIEVWLRGHLTQKEISFEALGLGETKPVSPNTLPDGSDNPAGRAKNRRVEIIILTK